MRAYGDSSIPVYHVILFSPSSEENDYHRDFLPPVTAQPSQHASVPASLLEQHAGELSATQEWEIEWNSQGLLSRLTPEVCSLRDSLSF